MLVVLVSDLEMERRRGQKLLMPTWTTPTLAGAPASCPTPLFSKENILRAFQTVLHLKTSIVLSLLCFSTSRRAPVRLPGSLYPGAAREGNALEKKWRRVSSNGLKENGTIFGRGRAQSIRKVHS